MTISINRRRFLQLSGLGTGGLALGSTVAGCRPSGSGGPIGGNTLKINSFGGTFQEAIESVVVPSFESEYDAGVAVTTAISNEALAQLKASPTNSPALDVVYMDLAPAYQAKAAGVLEKMDPEKIPNLADIYPIAKDPHGYWVAELASMTGIAYNTEEVENPPTSWADLWDPAYKGRVAISDVSATAGYQFLAATARINGGSETDPEPGFKALEDLKPNLAAIYKSPDEMSRLLTTGEAWLGPWYADRLSALKRDGAPVGFVTPTEGAVAILSSMCLAKGTQQFDRAHQWIDHQLSPEVNKEFIEAIAEGPTNKKVTLDKEFLEENYVPYGTDAINDLVSLDNEAVANNLSDWVTRWQSDIAN